MQNEPFTASQVLTALSCVWPETKNQSQVLEWSNPIGHPRKRITCRFTAFDRTWRMEIAATYDSKFYLLRSLRWSNCVATHVGAQRVVTPCKHGPYENWYLSICEERSGARWFEGEPPDWTAKLGPRTDPLRLSHHVFSLIESGLLCAWPDKLHAHIRQLDAYFRWKDALHRLPSVKLTVEHGDLAPNNILHTEDGLQLVDFEFAKPDQVAGYDLYANARCRKARRPALSPELLHYMECKWNLCHAINREWESHCVGALTDRSEAGSIQFKLNDNKSETVVIGRVFDRSIALFDTTTVHQLNALSHSQAALLANRWHADRQAVYVLNMAPSSPLLPCLERFSLSNIMAKTALRGPVLRTIRRIVSGKQLFACIRRDRRQQDSVSVCYGSLFDHMRRMPQRKPL
jgi:hypothetical protein